MKTYIVEFLTDEGFVKGYITEALTEAWALSQVLQSLEKKDEDLRDTLEFAEVTVSETGLNIA